MRRKITALVLALAMALTLCACDAEELIAKIIPSSNNWVDSDLIGSVTADMEFREQDDFAAAANKEWKLQIGEQYSGTADEIFKAVLARKKQAVTDTAIPGATAEVLRDYYALASDWEARNRDGMEPLRPYLDTIAAIDSGEKLLDFFTDREKNPLGFAPVTVGEGSVVHADKFDAYGLMLSPPSLTLEANQERDYYYDMSVDALERLEQTERAVARLLGRLGYSEDEARETLEACIAFEKKIAAADTVQLEPEKVTFERAEALALAGDYPLEKILNAWGFADCGVLLLNPDYAKKLSRIWSEANLEDIRAYLTVHYALSTAKYLDREAYETVRDMRRSLRKEPPDTGETEEKREDDLMFEQYIGGTPMVGAMNRVYVENFFDDAMIADLHDTTKEIIETFKDIFREEDWLSDEGKSRSIEKLDAISIHIAHQDFDSVDYGKLRFAARAEGGNFLEAFFAAERFGLDHWAWLSTQPYNAAYWDPVSTAISTTATNAVYRPDTNGIYIFAGMCEAPAYAPEMRREEKLAGIFTVVGHEITHGFDRNGALYDKEGKKNTWLPYEDQKAFNDRSDRVALYYSNFMPYPASGQYKGTQVNAEATADMGGLRVTLRLASKIPDFDYDLYFRSYAKLWRTNVTLETEKNNFAGDVHPLNFYRINVGVQQFDEFYETYDVQPGDGMYLAPGERIKVW